MKRRLPSFALSLTFGAVLAQGQTAVERAREGEARQGQIQVDAQGLVGQFDAMVDEYERNALTGEEMKTFKELRGLLGRLSGEEMEKIRATLQAGVKGGDPQAALKAIAEAYAAQKGVLGEFKRVLAEHERNQEALRLSRQVSELADRQAANLQTGITMAQWSLGRSSKTEMEASLAGQSAEQKAIADDLKLLRGQLEAFAKNGENQDSAARINKGLEKAAEAAPQLDAALKALGDKQVFNAVTAQKAARDAMRQMARTIAPPKDEAETLRQAAEQVDKLLAQQKEALTAAVAAKPKLPMEWVADELKNPKSALSREVAARKLAPDPAKLVQERGVQLKYSEARKQAEGDLAALESKQGDLVNQADALSQDLATVAKSAAEALQAAIPKMQEARAAANAKAPQPAALALAQSLDALEKAKADLGQRVAAADQAKEMAANPVAALQNLQKQTQDLQKQEQALAQKDGAPAAAKAAQQVALQQKAQQLQQQAKAAAPVAAAALGKAAANMEQAAAAMNKPAQAAAAPAQQQAMQNLAQAEKQVAQQLAQMQQAPAGAAALEAEASALAKLIVDQQQLELETAVGMAKPEKSAHPLLVALAPRQDTIRHKADELKTAAPGAAPVDQKTLASAAGHMDSAKGALEKADGRVADPEEQAALKDLYALQDQAQAQLAAAQAPPGAPPAPDPKAAEAAATALAKAQAQAAQAAAALAAAMPPGAQPGGAPPSGAKPAGAQMADAKKGEAGAPPAGAAMADAKKGEAAAVAGAPPAGAKGGAPAAGAPPSPAMAKAALQLNAAASAAGAAAAQAGAAPQAAKDAIRQAAADLAAAAAAAGANQGAPAQADTAQAQQAMAQAQAALAQAQAGIASAGGPPSPGAPGSPKPGQPGAPGQGPAGPPGQPGGMPPVGGSGDGNFQPGGGNAVAQAGGSVGGKGQFVGLPERDRATIRQAQSEKYPQQYATEVEQYLKNLSDESTPR